MNIRHSAPGGAHYLNKGLSLVLKPGIRKFVLIPLTINMLLLSFATFYAFSHISSWYSRLQQSDNGIIQWILANLDWLLWPLLVISVLIVVFYAFALLANWIAAPFNGLLTEAVENYLVNGEGKQGMSSNQSAFKLKDFIKEIPGLFLREWHKFSYYAPRAIGCLIIIFTPLAFIAPLVWFLFNAWMAAVQYIDYPMDNHRVPFKEMLFRLRQKRAISMGFGIYVMFITLVPLLNIFLMPVAVAGATNLWHDHFRAEVA